MSAASIARSVAEVEAQYGVPVVALVMLDGNVYDHCFTWETGQNYAQSGYKVVAIRDDGHMSEADAQSLYEYERDCYLDCFSE